jgi:hypothetical protein
MKQHTLSVVNRGYMLGLEDCILAGGSQLGQTTTVLSDEA